MASGCKTCFKRPKMEVKHHRKQQKCFMAELAHDLNPVYLLWRTASSSYLTQVKNSDTVTQLQLFDTVFGS